MPRGRFGYGRGFGRRAVRALALLSTGATNLLLSPQDFTTSWTWSAVSVTANAGVAPDGNTTADKIIPDTTNAGHMIFQSTAVGAGTFTWSIYAKAAGYPRLGLRVLDGSANQMVATFDISTGGVVSLLFGTNAFCVSVGNGWFFCGLTGSTALNMGSVSGWQTESLPSGVLAQQAFVGDGTSGALFWQAQVVAGSSPGPIIWG